MADLLHEYWENEDGGEFGPVQQRSDQLRSTLTPGARLIFSFRAPSWHRAMQLRNERLGYGDYRPAEDLPDHFYSEEEAVEQDAYLRVRNGG